MKEKILQSGIIFTAISFVVGGGHFVLQGILRRNLSASGEYGLTGATESFTALLGLPLLVAITAVTHHVAHFRGTGDEARLNGLLVGCRSFLLKATIVLSVVGLLLIQPLSRYFEIPRATLTLTALIGLFIALWSGYAIALAQGMGWFKRLALLGLVGVGVKIAFAWIVTIRFPVAEAGGLALAIGALVNLAVFVWWRDLFKQGERISPWDRAFFRYLVVAAAGIGAGYCFTKADQLVAVKYLSKTSLDAYIGAGKISSALYLAVAPLLTVLFTARSTERAGSSIAAPIRLLLLYGGGLAVGALVLFFARGLCVRLLIGAAPPATIAATTAMVGPFAVTMIFAGLVQALGMWAMASNWFKFTLLYGAMGLAYWGTLATVAHRSTPVGGTLAPPILLHAMAISAATAFVIMFVPWIITLRRGVRTAAN